jgi:carbon-monoxide dehydrogenase large subunit
MTAKGLGVRVRRKEDHRFLTGQSRFVADIMLSGMRHIAILRSPHAHARVVRIDTSAAQALEGVEAVLTRDTLPHVLKPIPPRLGVLPGIERFLQYPLAGDIVRYVGEPLAVVVARDRYIAEDGVDRIEVTYDPLPIVTGVSTAMQPGTVELHAGGEHNIAAHIVEQVGDIAAALQRADVVVHERFTTNRHAGVPMETRGLVAQYERGHDVLTVWGVTKVPHINRRMLAEMLDMPPHRIVFIEPDVGGGFGVRGEFYPEDFLVPCIARHLGVPVKWVEDRREHLQATNHSRQQTHEATLALTQDGLILGLQDRFYVDIGAYVRTHGFIVPALTASMLPGPYRIPNYRCDAYAVLTNKTPVGTYRSPGRYEANFVRERLLDIAAARLGMDPAALRFKNLLTPEDLPYDVGTTTLDSPTIYDSGNFPDALHRALEQIEYAGFRAQQAAWRDQGIYRGIGIGYYMEKTGLGPFEGARVHVDNSGKVVIWTGATHLGQGLETTLSQICAEVLHVDFDDITVRHGDTTHVPYGVGTFASRATVMAGNATYLASQRVREKIFALAALHLEATPADLELHDGRVQVRGTPSRGLSLQEVAQLAMPQHALPRGLEPGLEATEYFHTDHMTYVNGVAVVIVEVDVHTGLAKLLRCVIACDIGRAVNPMIVEGQIAGGAAQGIGGALYEELVYDQAGQLLTASFMDYLLPSTMEVPKIEAIILESPTPLNPLGVKGVGEGGIAGMGGAVANAIADALAPYGVQVHSLPLHPSALYHLMQRATAPPTSDHVDS